jgi:hypothetical protein
VFYIGMMVGPGLGGIYATWSGTASAAFDFGPVAVFVGAAMLCAVAYFLECLRRPRERLREGSFERRTKIGTARTGISCLVVWTRAWLRTRAG